MVDISSEYELTISFGLQVANEKGSPCIQSRIIVCQMICIDLHNKHVERGEKREKKKQSQANYQ